MVTNTVIFKRADYVYLRPQRAAHIEERIKLLHSKRQQIYKYVDVLQERTPRYILEHYEETSSVLAKYKRTLYDIEENNTFQDFEGFFAPMQKEYDV
jgi:hypothetical protein